MNNVQFYVIGAFEDFNFDIYPTHISPIIVEINNGRFRRWIYIIKKPYELVPIKPSGEFKDKINELFPVVTYQLYNTPYKLKRKSQSIAVSKNSIIVSDSKIKLTFLLVYKSIPKISNKLYFSRFLITLKNIYN